MSLFRYILMVAALLALVTEISQACAQEFIDLKADPAAAGEFLAGVAERGRARVFVTVKAPSAARQMDRGPQNLMDYIESAQIKALDSIGPVNFNDVIRLEFSPGMSMAVDAEQLERMLAGDLIESVYEVKPETISLAESGPLMGVTQAWSAGATGKGQAVAVLDTGVDRSHPFFGGRVVAEACFSPAWSANGIKVSSLCPNGKQIDEGPGAAKPCRSDGDCIHGTHVAGIVAGKGSNFSGVAPDAKILAAQVFSFVEGETCGKAGSCIKTYADQQAKALEWVYKNRDRFHIAAVNMSLGGGEFPKHCSDKIRGPIIEKLRRAGVAVVVSSGNDYFSHAVKAPACIESSISVGSTDKTDSVSGFSNSASILNLLAPGGEITSALPAAKFGNMSGTSMAAPQVAGAFAVLRSVAPSLSVDELLSVLKKTGRPIKDHRNGLTRPRIQVDRAAASLGVAVKARPKSGPSPRMAKRKAPSGTHPRTPRADAGFDPIKQILRGFLGQIPKVIGKIVPQLFGSKGASVAADGTLGLLDREVNSLAARSADEGEALANLSAELPRIVEGLAPRATPDQQYRIVEEMRHLIEQEGPNTSRQRQTGRRSFEAEDEDVGGIRVYDSTGEGSGIQW